jgi:flagellar hook assembly protein FlgD
MKDPSSRLLRWRLLLEEYQFEIVYRAVVQNVNADALSRYRIVGGIQISNQEMSEEYQFEVVYGAGAKNVNADALSRYPIVGGIQISNKKYQEKEN